MNHDEFGAEQEKLAMERREAEDRVVQAQTTQTIVKEDHDKLTTEMVNAVTPEDRSALQAQVAESAEKLKNANATLQERQSEVNAFKEREKEGPDTFDMSKTAKGFQALAGVAAVASNLNMSAPEMPSNIEIARAVDPAAREKEELSELDFENLPTSMRDGMREDSKPLDSPLYEQHPAEPPTVSGRYEVQASGDPRVSYSVPLPQEYGSMNDRGQQTAQQPLAGPKDTEIPQTSAKPDTSSPTYDKADPKVLTNEVPKQTPVLTDDKADQKQLTYEEPKLITDQRPRTKDEWLARVASSPPDAWGAPEGKTVAVLYSGYQGQNREAAKADCDPPESDKYRIEQTTAGKQLDAAQLYNSEVSGLNRSEADQVWAAASSRFAQNIDGPVETHILSSDKNLVARGTELPMLNADNTRVTTINGIDRAKLADMAPTEAYYAICQAELAQTQARARQAEDPTLAQDLSDRAQHKEAGLQALVGRDMAWNAQHSADPATAPPDARLSFEKNEKAKQVPPPDERQPQPKKTPKDIPSPNEFSPPAFAAISAPTIQPPSDDVPSAPTAPPIANDNSVNGPPF